MVVNQVLMTLDPIANSLSVAFSNFGKIDRTNLPVVIVASCVVVVVGDRTPQGLV
ncbi:hypothetical protein SAMD00079811_20920 [Scytonema sp. HK-05]|uniref:hypothetical protein n=1 Tax=Scytonema sp. HK-05 TaxID=1137095 RepID=UPI000B2A69DB|nr:hypothetical protein [Scytonema sp. HK-05]BAY44492.1 hypothetical protein SAMD00079811_20920 [Scytonema sp. HK-05]